MGGLAAAEELGVDVGAEGVGDEGGAERVLGIFLPGHEGPDDGGLQASDAVLFPVAADERVHESGFDDALGAEFFVVLASDIEQVGFVLSGDDAGAGPGAVFERR
jgi:hypothetical protein